MDSDKEAIEEVIVEAYINGIHRTQDKSKIESGFHPDFAMLVLNKNNIEKVTAADWLVRIEKMKKDNPELWQSKTSYDFQLIDIAKHAAMAKLNVFKGTTHFSTDYMLLYKFDEGWKIVSKVFTVP